MTTIFNQARDRLVLCIGAAHWDVIGRATSRLAAGDDVAGRVMRRPGGVALNVAIGLARHGLAASLCSVVGDDAAGRALMEELEGSQVHCLHVLKIQGAATGHYLAIEDDSGDLFSAVADTSLLDENAGAIVQQATVALQSAGAVVLEANLAPVALKNIARESIKAGVQIVANPVSPAKAGRLSFLVSDEFAPTLVVNLAEANVLLGQSFRTSRDAAMALRAKASGTALVTDGARLASLATKEDVVTAMPPDAGGEVSVTGAGDALLSAFLAAQDRQYTSGESLQFALRAAADHISISETA